MLKARFTFLIISVLLTCGCTIKPWVQSHERGILADPIMAFERDGVSSSYLNHVFEAREAGRGAEGSSGGGCGCN